MNAERLPADREISACGKIPKILEFTHPHVIPNLYEINPKLFFNNVLHAFSIQFQRHKIWFLEYEWELLKAVKNHHKISKK